MAVNTTTTAGCLLLVVPRLLLSLLLACVVSLCVSGVAGEVRGRASEGSCAYYKGKEVENAKSGSWGPPVLDDKGRPTVTCRPSVCFSFWNYTAAPNSSAPAAPDDADVATNATDATTTTAQPPAGTINWLVRGCWGDADYNCNSSRCVASGSRGSSYFCCCTGHMCNAEVEVIRPTQVLAPTETTITGGGEEMGMWWWGLVGGLFLALVILVVGLTALCWRRNKPPPQTLPVPSHPTSPCIDLDTVKVMETIGQGRFGMVYRALVEGQEVAVKMFPHHHKSSYVNEKYIYSLPLMEHPNLLSYLGGGEHVAGDGNLYFELVLSYCPRGRLCAYLAENTIPWATFCQIVLSATRGLAHLHSEIRKGDIIKPCISHRDFNTRNLLLKGDLTCVVSDLGFAIHTQGSKYYTNGEEQHAETSSLTDVGTLRYMAPEVLEGAVNLRDCEAALKQIDMYALGLVLWECAARCHDLYQGLHTPPYKLPFEAEIGPHPSFEQVQVLVARNKARPLFPPVWKDTNPAIHQLKETIEDCWDHDAEARLSAMCAERRLSELPVMWDRYKSNLGMNGISPTLNPMANLVLTQRQGDMPNGKIISNIITPRDKETSTSEATVETTVPASPSEPPADLNLAKNQLVGTLQPPIPPLQPHQGRNPCMERNLVREVPRELSVSGNILVDHLKARDLHTNSVNLMDALDSHEQLMPLLNGHSNAPSNHHPPMPQPTLVHPIPYLQNEVRSMDNQPKRQNTAARALEHQREAQQAAGKGGSWRRWRSAWEDRLKALLPRRRHHQAEDEERQEILFTPTSSSLSEPPTPLTTTQALTISNLPLHTEVLLTNGGPHTVISPHHALNINNSAPLPNYITATEIGIAKLHMQNGFVPVVRSRQGSKDSGLNKSSENSVSFVDSDNSCEKLKRPTTLILPERPQQAPGNNNNKEEEVESVMQEVGNQEEATVEVPEESPPLRKAKHRVKTPRRPLNPRLSLYDDRIMGCMEDGSEKSGQLDEGLSHSLPLHMDHLEPQRPFLGDDDAGPTTPARQGKGRPGSRPGSRPASLLSHTLQPVLSVECN